MSSGYLSRKPRVVALQITTEKSLRLRSWLGFAARSLDIPGYVTEG